MHFVDPRGAGGLFFYYFFAVFRTALKWAALRRLEGMVGSDQMGRVAGSKQWLAEEDTKQKKKEGGRELEEKGE